jgi:hypothetical protein
MEAVKKNTPPGVKLQSAVKFSLNGEDAYEVRGKDSQGKIHEVEVSASGKLIEVQ